MQSSESYTWQDTHVVVIGLGMNGGGIGTVKYLLDRGAYVTVTDLKSAERLQTSVEQINAHEASDRVTFQLGTNDLPELASAQYVIKSPAVPQTAPLLEEVRNYNIPILTDVDIFFQELYVTYAREERPLVIGVTGTRGKSTTTTLIYELLRANGTSAVLGGNIGTSVLEVLPQLTSQTVVVLELSSFQLEDLYVSPQIGVVTNLYPDHLDRHGTMQAYRDAKANIVRHQSSEDWAVLNAEQAWVSSMAEDTPSQVRYYSTHPFPTENQKGVWLDAEGNMYTSHANRSIAHTSDIALRGTHNVKNVLAALSVANILNIPSDVQVQVLRTFSGLPNRLEVVRTYQEVTYVNDTTSTMPEATLAALEVFSDQPVHLIAGGQSKDVSYQELIETIQTSSVRTIILLPGTASELLQTHLRLAANQELHTVDNLQTAVTIAQQKANPNDVVLFSPAATSFASFENEFDRGEAFRQAVHTLT